MKEKPDIKSLGSVSELRYINADNVTRCQAIMRYFYLRYERLSHWLSPGQIYTGVMEYFEKLYAGAVPAEFGSVGFMENYHEEKLSYKPLGIAPRARKGQRKCSSGDFCWKMGVGSIRVYIFLNWMAGGSYCYV